MYYLLNTVVKKVIRLLFLRGYQLPLWSNPNNNDYKYVGLFALQTSALQGPVGFHLLDGFNPQYLILNAS